MGAAAPSSELFQVGTRDEAALPIPFHCPPAILPLQDDFQDVSSGDIQLVRILGKRTKVRWAGRAALGALGLGSGWHPPPGSKCKLVSWVGRVLRATCGLLEPQDEAALWAGVASGDRKWVGYLWDSASHPPGLSL